MKAHGKGTGITIASGGHTKANNCKRGGADISAGCPIREFVPHKAHQSREPHDFGKNTSAVEAKGRKAGNARGDSSRDCSSSRITAQAGGTPVKNTQREGRRVLKAEQDQQEGVVADKFRIDSQKLIFHPKRVTQLLVGKDDWEAAKEIYPIYVEVSPVGACNHRCTFCAVDYIGYKAVRLDANLYAARIAEMASLGVKSVMMAGEGEPLLHKDINRMVDSTVFAGVDVAFTTNGVLLDKLDCVQACKWIKVSLNAGTKETYAKVHRTKEQDWDRVWGNLRALATRKGPCTIGVQMVLLPENEHEAPLLQELCDDAGVDYLVLKPYSQHKFSITHEYEDFIPIVPSFQFKPLLTNHSMPPKVSNVVVRHESIQTKEIPYDKCHATPYLWAYIMATGDLYSCSAYLLDDRFRLGNLNDQTFKEVWHGERRRENWELVSQHLNIGECRVNCRMDKSNRYLDELINGVPHVNFI